MAKTRKRGEHYLMNDAVIPQLNETRRAAAIARPRGRNGAFLGAGVGSSMLDRERVQTACFPSSEETKAKVAAGRDPRGLLFAADNIFGPGTINTLR